MSPAVTLTLLFSAAALLGCTDKATDASPDPVVQALILNFGPPTGTVNSTGVTSANYNSTTNKTTVETTSGSATIRASSDGSSIVGSPQPFTFLATIVGTGHLSIGTYTAASSGITGTIVITNNGPQTWDLGSTGTFTLKIKKITVLTNTANGTAYLVDGTLDAMVPAVSGSGATGTVMVHATIVNN